MVITPLKNSWQVLEKMLKDFKAHGEIIMKHNLELQLY